MATNRLNLQTYRHGQSWASQILDWAMPVTIQRDADGIGYFQSLGYNINQYNSTQVNRLIEEGYVTNPHLFAVLNHILTPSLSIPWYTYIIKDKKEYRRYINAKSHGYLELADRLSHKAVDIYDKKTSLSRILDKPNEKQTFEQVHQSNLGMLLLTGNAYMYGVPSKMRSVSGLLEILPLPSQFMEIVPNGNWDGSIESYILHLSAQHKVGFTESEIMHVKNFNPQKALTNGVNTLNLYGLSPLSPLCKVIKQSNDGYLAQMRLLQNGHPLGILSNGSSEPMLQTDAEDAQTRLGAEYGGADNKGKIKLTTANLKWISMGMNSVDLQLSQQQGESLATICAIYGLPTPNVTGQNANFNTGKEAEKQKWNDAILPPFNVLRDHYNRFFRKHFTDLPEGVFIDYDHTSVPALQQDFEKQNKIILSQLLAGLMNGEEANRFLGNDVATAEHHKKYLLTTNTRFTDEPLPGRTDINNNDGKTD